jgi:hypothetical protein
LQHRPRGTEHGITVPAPQFASREGAEKLVLRPPALALCPANGVGGSLARCVRFG